MSVKQIYTYSSLGNFTYLVEEEGKAWVIDPYSSEQIIEIIEKNNLKLEGIINTHDHWDHTKGNRGLSFKYGCKVYVHKNSLKVIDCATDGVTDGKVINLSDDKYLQVFETPGHTASHICLSYYEDQTLKAVFTGDTLFNAGVGNCRNGGDPVELYGSISGLFYPLSNEVVVYPGHDYIKNNLNFTLSVEKNNKMAKDLLTRIEKEFVGDYCSYITTIGEEKEMNTFFRLKNEEIRKFLNKAHASDKEVFIHLRSLRDQW